MNREPTNSDRKDPDIAEGTKRAADKVPDAVDRAGDNTPTKPGTEAENAAAGTNETRPDSAQLPESA
ncbi:MAG: hypothetical protein DMG80_18535 [Acidobacteria bacterium]|nr:MAG: hypothetical protein DMG80_18535 [Acidobacteriota bacterium]